MYVIGWSPKVGLTIFWRNTSLGQALAKVGSATVAVEDGSFSVAKALIFGWLGQMLLRG